MVVDGKGLAPDLGELRIDSSQRGRFEALRVQGDVEGCLRSRLGLLLQGSESELIETTALAFEVLRILTGLKPDRVDQNGDHRAHQAASAVDTSFAERLAGRGQTVTGMPRSRWSLSASARDGDFPPASS